MTGSADPSTDTGRRGMGARLPLLSLRRRGRWTIALAAGVVSTLAAATFTASASPPSSTDRSDHGAKLIAQGKETFRFDTFGDEAFWGGVLHLNQAIAGANNGGVGPGVSPRTALAVGLKVDVNALPDSVRQGIANGQGNLDDPAVTLALPKLNAG